MMQPFIGITGRKDTSARLLRSTMFAIGVTYVTAIQKVGGTAVIVPSNTTEADWEVLLAHLDGLLLSGGEDIAPEHYQQDAESWLGQVDRDRDAAELGLVARWLEQRKPLLGICRGHQLLNVALGGTLYQDIAAHIPNTFDHAYTPARPMEMLAHPVKLEAASHLAAILGSTDMMVNSAHHQSVQTPGQGLAVVACAPDGIIEATELQAHEFALSVQWHPEAMVKTSESMWPLFEAFVNAARG